MGAILPGPCKHFFCVRVFDLHGALRGGGGGLSGPARACAGDVRPARVGVRVGAGGSVGAGVGSDGVPWCAASAARGA
ncbi:hypothetical protein GCM10010350_11810 [Streptomyces galilaeus]|nr:hypothetical protein GCM10010350_11810 [Streptomyces galilaeus]